MANDRLQREFEAFHRDNPRVYELFKRFTFEAIRRGHAHLSARMIFHRIRWETFMSMIDPQGFKVNKRMFMRDYPHYADFFRTREAAADTAQNVHLRPGQNPSPPTTPFGYPF
jgi:hypothetical protein